MIWLKRTCWLAAWGVWVWLGFGLYRELPRRIGKKLCEIPLARGESVIGFVGASGKIAVQSRTILGWPEVPSLKIFDARSGVFVRHIEQRRWPIPSVTTCRNHGVVFTRGEHMKNTGFHLVDLETGEWKTLSEMMVFDACVYPTRPWVAFRESAAPIDKPRQLVVVDWKTSAEVFVRPRKPEYESVGGPYFLGHSDRLVVPLTKHGDDGVEVTDLEVWKIGSPSVLEKVVRGPKTAWRQTTNAGRIAMVNANDREWNIDVFDLETGKVIFSTPPFDSSRVFPGNYVIAPPLDSIRLSASGRALMTGPYSKLWNVDTGELSWQSKSGYPARLVEGADLFEVEELWDQPWTHGRLRNWTTAAFRDLDTAGLRFRCWNVDAAVLQFQSSDGLLGMTPQGVVYQLPFEVNWPLLSVCQTILALPLVLMWVVLPWRRKRRQPAVNEVRDAGRPLHHP